MDKIYESKISLKWGMEAPGIDPGTSRMLSERSTIWATPPDMVSYCWIMYLNSTVIKQQRGLNYP